MAITLTPELDAIISERAQEQGTTAENLIMAKLQEEFLAPIAAPKPPYPKGSLAERLQDYIGVIHSSEITPGGASMSVDMGEKFAEGLAEKRRQGGL